MSSNTDNEFGFWASTLSEEEVFAAKDGFAYPCLIDGEGKSDLIFLTQSAVDQRSVLMRQSNVDGPWRPIELTPDGYELGTKINEYGGKPFTAAENSVYFSNRADQRIYRQCLDSSAVSVLSPAFGLKQQACYAEINCVGDHLLSICEQQRSQEESRFGIVCLSAVHESSRLTWLIDQSDFVSNLVVSPSGKRVAWVQWNHPNMPWDLTELWTADLTVNEEGISLRNVRQVDSRRQGCHCQLVFASDSLLCFSADNQHCEVEDPDNWWNLYAIDLEAGGADSEAVRLTNELRELGYPHWQFGDVRVVRIVNHELLVIASDAEKDHLLLVDVTARSVRAVDHPFTTVQHLNAHDDSICLRGLHAEALPGLYIGRQKGSADRADMVFKRLTPSTPLAFTPSVAQHIAYDTGSNEQKSAFAFFYPPKTIDPQESISNNRKREKPPLLVMVHGGPTSRAYGYLDLQKQYWTSRGFATLDINHRGSSGYGRSFRDSLYGQWGVDDADDVIAAIRHVTQLELVDDRAVFIRGKSAGGYAVLCALSSHPEQFVGGANYYGIGNLLTLAELTHKFESRYTDRLVGEEFDDNLPLDEYPAESKFVQRSPIHSIADIRAAMIVFQGAADNIVPPAVAHELIASLKSAGIEHQYVEYANEGHGFRQLENNVDAWRRELDFYRRILRNI